MNDRPLVFIDVETTGFSPQKCRITELAAIRYQNGVVTKKIVSLFKIDEPLHERITELTGLTDAMLNEASPFDTLFTSQLWDMFADDAIMVAHNAKFDYSFIQAEFQRQGVAFNPDRRCTCEMARALYPGLPNHKLQTLIEHFELTYTDRHRAEDDTDALIQFIARARIDHGDEKVQQAFERARV